MTHEEKTFAVILWLHENNIYKRFIHNLNKLKPNYDPFTEKELNEFLIIKSFPWRNTAEGIRFWNNVDNKYKEFYNNYIMKEEKQKLIKIDIPEGYEIDKEKSTFENIIFKKKEECWRAKEHSCYFTNINNVISGFFIGVDSEIREVKNVTHSFPNRNIFSIKKQAKSALAMAQISQIMANDKRFGGPVTDEEWMDTKKTKYVIFRDYNGIVIDTCHLSYTFLAFHTREQRDLFFEENEDLVRDYLMLD